MKLPKSSIEHHQFTLIIVVLLILMGVISFLDMPKTEDPLVTPPGTSIIVIYPGAGPSDVEELVVDPIETIVNELEDIKHLSAEASDGLGVVAVEFEPGSDADEKYDLVVQKVNSMRSQLPDGIHDLTLMKWSISDVQILHLALVSDDASYRDLEERAERLQDDMQRIPGVKNVKLWALPDQQVRISINMTKMAQWQLSIDRVIGAIQDANVNIPGGAIDVGSRRLSIKTSGSYESVREIENTVINAAPGQVVYLKDVAEVDMRPNDVTYKARFNGERCIYLSVSQKPGTNILKIFDNLHPVLDDHKKSLPGNVRMETVFDQSTSVSKRIRGFFMNLLQGIVLVGTIILLGVGARPALIVMLAIPISIMTAIGLVDMSGYGLQQMSIAGLVIALGLLVDNAIVVTENTSRFIHQGLDRTQAAVQGTTQIGWAVVSATTTTVLAFIPIILIQDVTGDFIRSMPVTVVYTLSASLLVSLTVTPYFASKLLCTSDNQRQSRVRQRLNRFIETVYRRTLFRALEHPLKVLIVSTLALILSLGLFRFIGVSFFPKAEKPQFFVNINLPQGMNLNETDRISKDVESVLQACPEIKTVASNIGHGNPRLYYNIIAERTKSNHAQLFVELESYNSEKQEQLIAELRKRFDRYPGAKIQIKELEQGPPVEAPVAIRVLGDNMAMLERIAGDVESMLKQHPGTVNIDNPLRTGKSNLKIKMNRDKAAMLGVRLSDIDFTVRAALNGLTLGEYRDVNGKAYDMVLRLPVDQTPRMSDLNDIYIASMSGTMIPLYQLTAVELTPSPLYISHHNMERSVLLTSDVRPGYTVDDLVSGILQKLDNYQWPTGYRYSIAGEQESRQESFGGMMQAILAALVGIFAVLVLQFRSWSQPLIVFSAIPLAIIGSILALLITGNSFSFSAFIGLTSLVGIVVNNSIILVDYSNQLLRSGKSLIEAVQISAETRFVPIVLTALTTIGGLLPLTLTGGTMWAQMGWTIIGGLLVSTLLTLLIVPVLYSLFTKTA
ncbi:MAG: efflux RND transporter permease subunit [candidate division KSB1 bacterium]|nr:efflux RND transporter permease subunit [candidate division KSB1 bacterium]